MTAADKTGATPHVAPALPDLPPPMPEGEEGFDPSNLGPVKQLWDVALAYGPLSRAEAHKHRPVTSWNYREYVRWHPKVAGDTSMSTMMKADKWSWDRAIDLSLERGWIILDEKGLLTVGIIPPNHKPMATKSLATVQAELDGGSTEIAMKILTAKVNHARMRPQTAAKNALKKDLQARGQLQPIKVWKPSPMVHEHEIIVDGVTRAALLEELGIEPWKVYLPEDVTPTEVLLQRISHEMNSTTKDTTTEARDAYIAQLAELGFPADKIAKQVDLTRRRVEQILSASETHFVRGHPSADDVAEFVLMRDAGWHIRDIAERTQWGKSTVSKYLAAHDAGTLDAKLENPTATPATDTNASVMLGALVVLERASIPDACEAAGLDRRAVSGTEIKRLVSEGLIKSVGKEGRTTIYAPTSLAVETFSAPESEAEPEAPDTASLATVIELPMRDPAPAPAPAPTPRKPRAGRTIEKAAASIDRMLKGGGFTREQLIEYWNEHPDKSREE